MKKTKFFIYMTAFMIVATTIVMVLGFLILPATRSNFILITVLNLIGYSGALCYYDLYLREKGGKGF